MSTLTLLAFLVLNDAPPPVAHERKLTVGTATCKTVSDCWLDDEGKPIARPKKLKGKKPPKPACGGPGLNWLRNRLTCEEGVCTSEYVGDKC